MCVFPMGMSVKDKVLTTDGLKEAARQQDAF
jgi:hypothetical protein